MGRMLGSVAALLAGMGLVQIGNSMLTTLLGLRMYDSGFSTEMAGLVMSVYFAGQMAGSRLVPRIIERVGHIRTFAAAAAMLAASAMVHVLLVIPIVWIAVRTLTGAAMATLNMVAESWFNEKATNATRGKMLAIYMIMVFTAMSSGQFILGLGDPAGFQLFVLCALLITLGVVPVATTASQAPAIGEPSRLRLGELWNVSPLGLAGVAGAGLVNSSFYGMAPLFARGIGFDIQGVASFMGFAMLSGLAMQWPMGWLSDRFDRRTVLTTIFFCVAAVSAAVVPFSAEPSILLIALGAAYGGLSFTVYSLSVSHANDFIGARDLVRASGGYVLIYGFGACIGPFASSTLMSLVGPSGLFIYAGLINLCLGAFAVYRMTRRPARPKDQQARHVPLPVTTPVIKELDPRREPREGGG